MADDGIRAGGEDLLVELASLYEVLDPVPPDLAEDVRIALTVEALQAELAELVATPALAVRAEDEPVLADTITFASGPVSLMVTVDDSDPAGLVVDGWVTGGGAAIELHVGDRVIEARADEYGRFVVTGVPRGRAWFVVRPVAVGDAGDAGDRAAIVTPAVEL